MAAPSFYAVPAVGATDAGGAWSFDVGTEATVKFLIFHALQDGATSGAVAQTGSAGVTDIGGAAGWTYLGQFAVGSPTAAYQHIWLGRSIAGVNTTISGTNSTSEDLYMRAYQFNDVSAGTTLATVIENGTAGSTSNGVGTSNSVSATTVTTLGPDRLALGLIGLNDDLQADLNSMTGESGGDWTYPTGSYGSSTGTDGAIGLINAAMASAGTISGGTDALSASIDWGCIGFALIGTTVSTVPRYPGVDSGFGLL